MIKFGVRLSILQIKEDHTLGNNREEVCLSHCPRTNFHTYIGLQASILCNLSTSLQFQIYVLTQTTHTAVSENVDSEFVFIAATPRKSHHWSIYLCRQSTIIPLSLLLLQLGWSGQFYRFWKLIKIERNVKARVYTIGFRLIIGKGWIWMSTFNLFFNCVLSILCSHLLNRVCTQNLSNLSIMVRIRL